MDFRTKTIKEIEDYLRVENIAAKIDKVSEVFEMTCEWCSNKSRAITVSFVPLDTRVGPPPVFDKGFACYGQGTYFEDKSFGSQAEWFACYKCEEGQ